MAEVEGGAGFGLLELAKAALEGLDFGGVPGGLVTFVYVVEVVFVVNKYYIAGLGNLVHSVIDEILFTVFDTEEGLVGLSVIVGEWLFLATAHS